MAHEIVPAAEEILDREFSVLDHGFVRLVDYNGGDQRIVQSARVSYGAGTKTYRQDRGLIHYLLRNAHTSPFEQVNLTFHAKMPIFVARQWVRHRTARLNEISGRYSVMKDEFYLPEGDAIAPQAQDNKQGRSSTGFEPREQQEIREALAGEQRRAYSAYEELLERDVARELARITLPVSTYTEWYWQIDLHNLFHFLALRMDAHAQYEIRAYGEVILDIARRVAPAATEAFEEYQVHAVRFSRKEFAAMQALLGVGSRGGATGDDDPGTGNPSEETSESTLRHAAEQAGLAGREVDRFIAKVLHGASG